MAALSFTYRSDHLRVSITKYISFASRLAKLFEIFLGMV